MITDKRALLLTNSKHVLEFVKNFEAIKVIESVKEIRDTWSKNKTPICLKAIYDEEQVELPEGIDIILWAGEDFLGEVDAFTRFCYENGFECGEYRTGKVYNTHKERCFLCELAHLKGMPNSLAYYNEHVENPVDCIIYESRLFYVVSELGAIKPGYLMIVPKQHILSVAQFPEGFMSEYHQVCADVETILKGAYGQDKTVVFFEHGSGPSGMTSHPKSIVHAHTHVVVGFQIAPKYLEQVQMKKIEDISEAKEVHYFSYQESAYGDLLVCMDPEVYVQRQYPRQIMAKEYGLAPGQYNWRNVAFSENVAAQLYNIYLYLSSGDETGNERIGTRTEGVVKGYPAPEDFPEV